MNSSGVDGSVAFVISGVNEAVLDAMTRFSSSSPSAAARSGLGKSFRV